MTGRAPAHNIHTPDLANADEQPRSCGRPCRRANTTRTQRCRATKPMSIAIPSGRCNASTWHRTRPSRWSVQEQSVLEISPWLLRPSLVPPWSCPARFAEFRPPSLISTFRSGTFPQLGSATLRTASCPSPTSSALLCFAVMTSCKASQRLCGLQCDELFTTHASGFLIASTAFKCR
jgi:hypothetical protein